MINSYKIPFRVLFSIILSYVIPFFVPNSGLEIVWFLHLVPAFFLSYYWGFSGGMIAACLSFFIFIAMKVDGLCR
ncbi:hypothetical protein CHH83_25200 [Bacillus sp. 7586-K]|uniref:hypothetical protein n=1 Tax=Metabacillus niabensis TaxID=324854 RepID=UPI000BA6A777|nr:hypothetical protein CHH83_25200 [Bacillus sp. 7586-K]